MANSTLRMEEMTEVYAKEISAWRYEGEYRLYDMPPWREMVEDGWALADPDKRKSGYFAFVTEENKLAAFTRHTMETEGIMLGVGVNPDSLSMGYGSAAIGQTVTFLTERYPEREIFLDVRTWNKRAVRSYEKAGFSVRATIEQETHAGKGTFYRMYLTRQK